MAKLEFFTFATETMELNVACSPCFLGLRILPKPLRLFLARAERPRYLDRHVGVGRSTANCPPGKE